MDTEIFNKEIGTSLENLKELKVRNQTAGKVYVDIEPGFVVVSLSKVVEVYADNLRIVCIDSNEFEFEMLDSIFLPTPRDEYLRDLIQDMVMDTSDGVERLFEIVEELFGEHAQLVKKEDYDCWGESYYEDFKKLLTDSIEGVDLDNVKIEVVVMKGVEGLIFVIFADGDSKTISLLEHDDGDLEDLDEEMDDESDELDDEII